MDDQDARVLTTPIASRTLSRRDFLELSAAGLSGVALASLLAACGIRTGPAGEPSGSAARFTGGGSLKILARSHFVPAYDTWLDQWAADWGARYNTEVTIDHILAGNLPEKWAAEVAAGAGHDLFVFSQSGAVNVYNKQLIDMSDIAEEIGSKYGWVDPIASNLGKFGATWKGVPEYFIDFPSMYRQDLFDANNLRPPDTWEDLMRVGTVLKGKGYPVGIAINQNSNDANNSWHSLLWSYGVSYAKEDGKMADFNTAATREVVKFAVDLYENTMTDEVLSWDDTGNNTGLLNGRLSWIQNPISALRTIEKEKPDLASNLSIGLPPGGPKGRFASVSTSTFGVMNWSQSVPAAKAFIRDYFAVFAEAVRASDGYNQPVLTEYRKKPMPILGEDSRLTALQDFEQVARNSGFPGPPTPAAAEVEGNWIVPLMIGRALQSGVDDAVSQATTRIEQIYRRHNLV